jgi:steroid delta-isomerase-like uncharacterized protein
VSRSLRPSELRRHPRPECAGQQCVIHGKQVPIDLDDVHTRHAILALDAVTGIFHRKAAVVFSTRRPMVSTQSQSSKTVVRRFIAEVWNADDLAAADELIHPDYAIEGMGRGPDAVKRNIANYRAAFPDLEWTIEQMVAEDDWVAVRLTLHGTHLGPLGSIPPTGKRIAMKEMVFWRVEGGRLAAIWSVGDALGLRVQLGAIPASAWHQPMHWAEDPT